MTTVLLDCDGVLADFTGHYLDTLFQETGRDCRPEHVTDWSFRKALNLAKDEEAAVVARICQPGWCSDITVLPGAVDGVRQLMARGLDVAVVTSPWNSCPTWTYEREKWLKAHFGIPHSSILHGSAKHRVNGDFMVDDRTSNVESWQDAEPMIRKGVLWDQPWNRKDQWYGARTNSWHELYALVTR